MVEISISNLKKIISSKKEIEKSLKVSITYNNNTVNIQGSAQQEYIAQEIIKALDYDFPKSDALLLLDENFLFEEINIKDYSKSKDFQRIRSRIIGKKGKTLRTLSNLTECHFQIKDNKIAIIGESQNIKNAQDSLISLIRGSKQSNIYNFLERNKPQPIFDFGLKKLFAKEKYSPKK